MSIILISGANRGIGLGLAQTYLARDDTTVIGTARNPSEATELSSSPKGKNSRLFVLRYEAGSRTAAEELVAQILENKIDHVDILIANGGIGGYWSPALTSEADKLDQFFKINSLGNLLLFQALYPLLEKSQKPIFSFLSSSIASTENMEKVPFLGTAYGASKAWMDHVIKRIHIEQPNMISFAIHPGYVSSCQIYVEQLLTCL